MGNDANSKITSESPHTNNTTEVTEGTMTEVLKQQFYSTFRESNPDDLNRFLSARDYNLKLATEMYSNYLCWYEKYRPWECDDKMFRDQLSRGKLYILSIEKSPIIYFMPREHDPDIDHYKQVVRFGCYIYELVIRNIPNSATVEFISFVNCNGVSLKNVDRKLIQSVLTIYQDYFPERLHSCYVYGIPPALTSVWNFIEKLLDERTHRKIVLLKKSQYNDVFSKYPKDILPLELGGTNEGIEQKSREILLAFHENMLAEKEKMTILDI